MAQCLLEQDVHALKMNIDKMGGYNTLHMGSPNLNYAVAKLVLARFENIANQRPMGIGRMTEK